MAVCVHCSTPTKDLLLSYGPDHVVCTKCVNCGQFADPYVEQEVVIVAIDLILVKPRAYRHVLFNRPHLNLPKWDKDGKKKSRHEIETFSFYSTWWTLIRQLAALFLADSYLRWFYLCSSDSQDSSTETNLLPTLAYQSTAIRSYLRITMASSLQLGTLFFSTLLLSVGYHRFLLFFSTKQNSTISKADLSRFQPHLVLTSLLLSHLTPVFLLSLLLLWHSNSSTSSSSLSTVPRQDSWQWDEDSIDLAIRSLVGGLSSGVALGVVLPLQKSKIGALAAISILILAWYLQLYVTAWLQLPFYSGVGVLQTPIGARAAQRYCR